RISFLPRENRARPCASSPRIRLGGEAERDIPRNAQFHCQARIEPTFTAGDRKQSIVHSPARTRSANGGDRAALGSNPATRRLDMRKPRTGLRPVAAAQIPESPSHHPTAFPSTGRLAPRTECV